MNRYVTELILLAKAEKPDFLRIGPVDLTELTDGMRSRARVLRPRPHLSGRRRLPRSDRGGPRAARLRPG